MAAHGNTVAGVGSCADCNVVVGSYSEAAADGIPSDPTLFSPADGSSTHADA